jgi:signal transduction histidine kinase
LVTGCQSEIMKTTIRTRLSFSHLLVLIIGMVLAGSLVWVAVENLYLSTQQENLLAQARLTAAGLDGSPAWDFSPDRYSQTTNVSPGIHSRLLNESGAVILGVPALEGDQSFQIPPSEDPGYIPAEELILRPEIQSALDGTAETAVRKVTALDNERVLYAAAPVEDENGNVTNLVYLAMPLPSQGLPGELALKLGGAILAGGIIASIIGILLARGLARPLEKLDQATSKISEGDLGQQVPVQGGVRELENLGQSFNQMTESLRKSTKAKNDFIADVTHELRTPLTVIKGTVETLEDGAIEDEEGRPGLLSSMSTETSRLIHLVNQLLILARSDAGALSLNLALVDLEELVRKRAKLMEPLAIQQEVSLKVSTSGLGPYRVTADRARTAQIIDNLLDNALRYAPTGSDILIKLESLGQSVRCSVEDSGQGIPAEDLPHIFERFYRVEKSRDRDSGGAGLGLAIARSLVEAQDGIIEAFSKIGDGTRMVFHLPKKLPDN